MIFDLLRDISDHFSFLVNHFNVIVNLIREVVNLFEVLVVICVTVGL